MRVVVRPSENGVNKKKKKRRKNAPSIAGRRKKPVIAFTETGRMRRCDALPLTLPIDLAPHERYSRHLACLAAIAPAAPLPALKPEPAGPCAPLSCRWRGATDGGGGDQACDGFVARSTEHQIWYNGLWSRKLQTMMIKDRYSILVSVPESYKP